ncbi:MAG: DUF6434 domain-containing protein [Rhodospirillaceae bacterium]
MADFDWHCDPITRDTVVNAAYRNTQNVRRFLKSQCGEDFKFDRPFMAWIKNDAPKAISATIVSRKSP